MRMQAALHTDAALQGWGEGGIEGVGGRGPFAPPPPLYGSSPPQPHHRHSLPGIALCCTPDYLQVCFGGFSGLVGKLAAAAVL